MSQITVHVQRMAKGIVSFPGHIFALGQTKHGWCTRLCVVSSKDCMIDKHECISRAETGLLYSWMHCMYKFAFLHSQWRPT